MSLHQRLHAIIALTAALLATMTYRPELHYMRGPGPKWRAKHARKTIVSEPGLGGVAKIAA